MPVAPKYVSTTWDLTEFDPYPDGPTITSAGVYITDQPTLDAVAAAAAASGVALTYSDTGSTPPTLPLPAHPYIRWDAPQPTLTDAEQAQARANLGVDVEITDQRIALARLPDLLITGAITRDTNGVITSATVTWPDGTTGTYTTLAVNGTVPAVDEYSVTYGSPATNTYTQPTVTRDSTGAVTDLPAIVVT